MLFLLSGCVTIYNPATQRRETLLIDTRSEVSLGSYMDQQVQNKYKISRDPKKQERLDKIGNKVLGYQIAKILRGQVVLLRNGKTFILNFPLGSEVEPIVTVSEDKRIINRNAVSKKVPDLNAAFKQAVPIPFIESGKIIGIKVTNIKDKSLAMKAGIKEGDVIMSVNNLKMDSLRRAMKILHDHSPVDHFLTVSIGVCSMIPKPQESPLQLVLSADNALYEAKQTGRNRTCFYIEK